VQVDDRFRVTIPKELREHIRPGDVLFVGQQADHGIDVCRDAKADNPFDALAAYAVDKYRDGYRRSLDQTFALNDGDDGQ
jgi:bifunctional DNA-binding transcriptional regulator/antitoxin component of YhaV-PrlF toxin-antitoxin module